MKNNQIEVISIFDLIVIGYLLHDLIDTEGIKRESIGGTAFYTSKTASFLGMKTGIVSKTGRDFKYFNELEGIDLQGLIIEKKQEKTTSFHNLYRNGIREQEVANAGEQIFPEDIPENYFSARAIHLGPVFNEIPFETIKFIRKNFSGFLTLDAQGFLRKEEKGKVLKKDMDYSILDFIDVIKVSEHDFKEKEIDKFKANCKIVLLTKGRKGSEVFWKEDGMGISRKIPYFKTNTVDETGAGDVYMAGFIYYFLKTKNPEKSALFASSLASFSVENFGLNSLIGLTEEKVLKRGNML